MVNLKKARLTGASIIALKVVAPALAATFIYTGAIETGTVATTGTYDVTLGGATTGAFVSLDFLPAAPSQVPLPSGMVLFGSTISE